jgi:DNA-binding transcriptional LysR family regulator
MLTTDILRQLPFFAVAAEEENFQRAARRLHITQPALSRRIQALERSLDMELFDRSQGRVRLTAAGQALSREVSRILQDVDRSLRSIRKAIASERVSLTLGINEHAMGIASLRDLITTYRRAHPDVDVRILLMSSARLLAGLQQNDLDIAALYLTDDDAASVESRVVLENDPYVIAIQESHRLAKLRKIRLADLKDIDLIWPSRERVPALYSELLGAWSAAGMEPRVTTQIGSAEAALNAVSAGMGIAVVRLSNRGREPPGVLLRPVADLHVHVETRLAWMRHVRSPARDEFVALLDSRGVIAPSGNEAKRSR